MYFFLNVYFKTKIRFLWYKYHLYPDFFFVCITVIVSTADTGEGSLRPSPTPKSTLLSRGRRDHCGVDGLEDFVNEWPSEHSLCEW